MFNVREGITRRDDTQPKRLLVEKSPSPGRAKGHVIYLKQMLDDYYRLRDWDKETGVPTTQKLKELGLEYTIPVAEKKKAMALAQAQKD
jgi:aldehyde:ferredoxin oxidoreductase